MATNSISTNEDWEFDLPDFQDTTTSISTSNSMQTSTQTSGPFLSSLESNDYMQLTDLPPTLTVNISNTNASNTTTSPGIKYHKPQNLHKRVRSNPDIFTDIHANSFPLSMETNTTATNGHLNTNAYNNQENLSVFITGVPAQQTVSEEPSPGMIHEYLNDVDITGLQIPGNNDTSMNNYMNTESNMIQKGRKRGAPSHTRSQSSPVELANFTVLGDTQWVNSSYMNPTMGIYNTQDNTNTNGYVSNSPVRGHRTNISMDFDNMNLASLQSPLDPSMYKNPFESAFGGLPTGSMPLSTSPGQKNSIQKSKQYRCGRCGLPKVGHVCLMPDQRNNFSETDLEITGREGKNALTGQRFPTTGSSSGQLLSVKKKWVPQHEDNLESV